MNVDYTVDKFNVRLVAQGIRQKHVVGQFDTNAPVARITTIMLLVEIASAFNLVIYLIDVKMTFLYGDLEEDIYMQQPEGFIMKGHEQNVSKLVKTFYGQKQAPKQWHQKFDESHETILSYGFELYQSDKDEYNKFDNKGNGVIVCLCV